MAAVLTGKCQPRITNLKTGIGQPCDFTTIPYDPSTANRHIESHFFVEIRPCINDVAYTRFKVLRNLQYFFMIVFRVFLR